MKNKLIATILISAILNFGALAYAQSVGDVVQWNIGSGQANGNFVRDYIKIDYANIDMYKIEFAMRAQERFVGPSYVPVYDNTTGVFTYTVPKGLNGSAAIWNFDMSINIFSDKNFVGWYMGDGTFNDIARLDLYITSDNGMTPIVVDLLNSNLRYAIDASSDQDHFYQFSQNLSWWSNSFDADAIGTYSFGLDIQSINGNYDYWTMGPLMNINVVPEPTTAALITLGGLSLLRKKRKL